MSTQQPDEWESWRRAGEFAGRLRAQLGCGCVSLRQEDSGAFRVTWDRNIQGLKLVTSLRLSDAELFSQVPLEVTAAGVAKVWKGCRSG